MATFDQFIRSIVSDGNDGKAFEQFCRWFLLNDPYWKTQVDKAWLFLVGPKDGVSTVILSDDLKSFTATGEHCSFKAKRVQ